MIQTNGTYEVKNGVLMADQDQCISILNARVIIQPLSQQPIVPRVEVTVQERSKNRLERMADLFAKAFIVAIAFYFVGEVAWAFWTGAFAKAVR